MRKVALVFVLAVLAPSLVLAWLAVRSLRDQQFLLERQESLLYQQVTDTLAQNISDQLAQRQQEFSAQVESLVASNGVNANAPQFNNQIRAQWPLADVGFSVALISPTTCKVTCPLPNSGPEAQRFLVDNGAFLGNEEAAEVYWNVNNTKTQNSVPDNNGDPLASQNSFNSAQLSTQPQSWWSKGSLSANSTPINQKLNSKGKARAVSPQNYQPPAAKQAVDPQDANLSKVIPAEAEFRQLVGDGTDGMLARFLQNKLKLMFWHRLSREPNFVFGAQLNLNRLVDSLRSAVQPDPALRDELCVALLDDNARPVALSHANFQAAWKRPFVATEIGEALPHWEIAAYLVNPAHLTQVARTAKLTLGLLIATLVLAIGVGGWLIVTDLNRQLALARQKTDFVSNVSHELKTPLTSIRMFSELLAEQRVADPVKQRSYLQIITAETARLTRLINNVLDFSRMERGEKKYNFRDADLVHLIRETAEIYRPHLENSGFQIECSLPPGELPVRADTDALAQVVVNLLSNAEKYSNGEKKITIEVARRDGPLPCAEVKILDRGPGVPRGSEEKIFEKFYRAHDSLSSGIQGSGLGLTLARQIARAHGGDVVYEPRAGGGSCFSLRLPLKMN
ncbi:MAG TPA: HAMP domain-containing sensor histidine kinase [Verrucomicrobiae bacterium]|nr:HAMP domain-containing sensor histidine kinase [Verrucomicrobiae bacterium]